MINGLTSALSNATLSRIAQSTTSSVSIETGLKAVGRPSFILADGKIEPQTKRYAAMKEFLYQATCLATYMLIITPIFKNGAFKISKLALGKTEDAFKKFKSAKEYLSYKKLAVMPQKIRLEKINEAKKPFKFSDDLLSHLKTVEDAEQYNIVKGAIEFGNIVGSVLGLAIFAPQVSHIIIHPVLKAIGMEKEESPKKELIKQNS
ncbi:hypothetical protein J6R97_08870 [bacterium]|nr:hypothetical protein [bacterium]